MPKGPWQGRSLTDAAKGVFKPGVGLGVLG